MSIAPTVRQFLDDNAIAYDVSRHLATYTSARTAQACHVSGKCVGKGVVISREGGFTLAVVPASNRVALDAVDALVPGPVTLASEDEIDALFFDCEAGAIPPLAGAYGLDAIVDDRLDCQDDVYFEAGDHRSLIHIHGSDFKRMTDSCAHADIAVPM